MAVDEHGREFDEEALLKVRESFNIFEHNDEIKREEIAKAAEEKKARIAAELAAQQPEPKPKKKKEDSDVS